MMALALGALPCLSSQHAAQNLSGRNFRAERRGDVAAVWRAIARTIHIRSCGRSRPAKTRNRWSLGLRRNTSRHAAPASTSRIRRRRKKSRSGAHKPAADRRAADRPRIAKLAGHCRGQGLPAPRPARTARCAARIRPVSMATPPASVTPTSIPASISDAHSNFFHHLRVGDHCEQRGAADDIADQHWRHELQDHAPPLPVAGEHQ